jgi:hypothetical protein
MGTLYISKGFEEGGFRNNPFSFKEMNLRTSFKGKVPLLKN